MTDEHTHHDPWQEAFPAAVTASGQPEEAVSRRLYYARWRADELIEALASEPGWYERLEREARAGLDAVRDHVRECVAAALEHGPRSLARMQPTELLALASPRLRDFASTYRPAEHGGALITGPTGIGKSVTAVALLLRPLLRAAAARAVDRLCFTDRRGPNPGACVAATPRAHGFLFVRAADLDSARRQHPLGEGEAPLVTAAIDAELLALDDVGHERDFAAVWDVVAGRYDRAAPTVATSGWPLAKLAEKYGAAAVRRLTEAGAHKGAVVEVWDA